MKKDKKYAERGITLVALVITVIVLLILAGVTVTWQLAVMVYLQNQMQLLINITTKLISKMKNY